MSRRIATPWGSTVRITGRVLGGYIPASSKLLRLDLGIVGIPGLSKIQGIPNVSPDGTFTTTYKFARYQGVVRFWLQVSSLAEADFPFSPSHSRRLIVTVGVPTPAAATTTPPPPMCVTAERATGIGARRSIEASRAAKSTLGCIPAAGRDGDERSDRRRASGATLAVAVAAQVSSKVKGSCQS